MTIDGEILLETPQQFPPKKSSIFSHELESADSPKNEFSAMLGQYIDYFQKSSTSKYQTIKASQYFTTSSQRENTQRSHLTQNNETIEALKSQVQKLKKKLKDIQLMNELLVQERKASKKKETGLQTVKKCIFEG